MVTEKTQVGSDHGCLCHCSQKSPAAGFSNIKTILSADPLCALEDFLFMSYWNISLKMATFSELG